MRKTTYHIAQMDCSAEEQLVRMKLDSMEGIRQLNFDLSKRTLEVYHEGDAEPITTAIHELKLSEAYLTSEPVGTDTVPSKASEEHEKSLLWYVLLINAFFFLLEMVTGIISNSMGLVADSLDMLADALVYGISLLAVGATTIRKKRVARISGYFQLILAFVGFSEIVRRFLGFGEVPVFSTMIYISLLALAGNVISLLILRKTKSDEAHIKASQIFTSNDVVINIGVMLAGVLVYFTASRVPDLLIGTMVFAIVIRGAFRILQLSK